MRRLRSDAGALDSIHVPFLVPSLLLGIFGGFTLAVTLPVQAAVGRFNLSWLAHAQVHGHLQVVGFATLFIVGVALRLAPRFGGRGVLTAPGLVAPAGILLVAGLLLRAVGQPLAHIPAFAALFAAGALAEWVAATALAAIFLTTLWPAVRAFDPPATLLATAFLAFAAQATLGLWWLTALALEGGTILEYGRNSALLTLQVYGVLLAAILGVGTKSFPALFGMPPPSVTASRLGFAALVAGLVLWAGGAALRAELSVETTYLVAAGMGLVGVSIATSVLMFGVGRLRHRFAPASAGFVWALQPVLLWLALSGIVLLWLAAQALLTGDAPPAARLDAARHIFLVGVVTLAILAMAQLMLPEFASERITNPPARWRGAAFGVALSLAVALRAFPTLAEVAHDLRWWLMAVAGLITLTATSAFALLYWRARRRHIGYMARIAALRARGTSLPVVER